MFNFRKFFSNFVNTPAKPKASPTPASATAVRKTPTSGAAIAVKKVTTGGASSRAIKPTPPKKVVQNAASQAPLIKPDSKKLNKSVASAEVYALAKGNPLAQNVLKALLHEGKPSHLSNHDFLKRFPQYGWDDEATDQANHLLNLSDRVGRRSKRGSTLSVRTQETPREKISSPSPQADGETTIEHYGDLLNQYNVHEQEIASLNAQLANPNLTQMERFKLVEQLQYIKGLRDEVAASLQADEAVDEYKAAVRSVYGVTIDDDSFVRPDGTLLDGQLLPADGIDALIILDNYRQGIDIFANWLFRTFESQLNQLGISSRYEAFRLIMGPITLARVSDNPGAKEASKGFTGDHIIYDRFDVYSEEMQAELIVHELAHAFVNSAGFGAFTRSPLYEASQIEDMLTALNNSPKADRNSKTSGFESGGDAEIIANFIQNLATGHINLSSLRPEEQAAINASLTGAFEINRLRHTDPTIIAQQNADAQNLDYSGTNITVNGINIRTTPEITQNNIIGGTNNTQITIIGRYVDEDDNVWLYVGINRNGWYDYGWINQTQAPDLTLPDNVPSINPP